MKTVSISGSPRVNVGKKDARELRRQGLVPCVIYGGKEQIHFSALEKDFKKLVYTPDVHIVKLDLGGRKFDAVMQDIQFHRLTDKPIHIDFLEVIPGKPVTINLPVNIEGSAPGVKAGGKLLKKMRTIKVSGLAEKMPESITLNVETLEIGDSIKVSDIKMDGIKLLDTPNATVVGVRLTRNVVEETPGAPSAAGAAAPSAAAPGAAGAAAPAAAEAKKGEAKKPEAKK